MAAMDFPASPTDGQVYENYVWSAATGAWLSRGVTQTTAVTSDVAPSNPKAGDMWYNSTDGVMYLYYYDGNSSQWVQFKNDASFTSELGPTVDALDIAGNVNFIINGAFEINQRNFSSTTTTSQFGFDRWFMGGSGGTITYSAQTLSPGTIPTAYESSNSARIVSSGQSGVGDWAALSQRIENVRTLAGQTVTVSFWAKAASGTPNVGITFEQEPGAGGSANTVTSATVKAITNSWARYSFTVTLPTLSGKTVTADSYVQLYIFTSAGTTLSGLGYPAVGVQNATIDFWGVQVQAGSKATNFHRAAPTLQGELAACQRYYYRSIGDSGVYTGHGTGLISGYAGGIYSYFLIPMPVTMRVAPTSIDSSAYGTFTVSDGVNVSTNTALPALSTNNSSRNNAFITATHGGLTSYRPAWFQANNTTSSYIGFVAEL
mgnify:CR=1 FL=1